MSVDILVGHVLDRLADLPDESVQCVVTSPPYWGLRDYGIAGQLGLEQTLGEHISTMVEVFREVRRVLRADGTLWLNYGDSYVGGGRGGGATDCKQRTNIGSLDAAPNARVPGLKSKDLCGVPWRVAFALQDDGWWLRQDIIWSKPNPMPESIRDRCTKAHEYLFLLAKSERYYYDAEAIKEQAYTKEAFHGDYHPLTPTGEQRTARRNGRTIKMPDGWDTGAGGHGSYHREGREKGKTHARTAGNKSHKYVTAYEGSDAEEHRTKAGLMAVADVPWEKRNKRSVWTIATAPFSEAHFATFPPALVEPCILAGCPEGGTVLDCFGGAGTTALVADRLQRNAILIELNPDYAAMARRRIEGDAPLFATVSTQAEAAE